MSKALTRDQLLYENTVTEVKVYQGTFQGQTLAAIKDQIHSDINSANQTIKELMSQIQLDHPNICKVYDCFLQPHQGRQVKSVLVMELMNQDVMKEIQERKATGRPWSEDELMKHLTDLVSALSYAQSKGVSHRDIKPRNLYLTSDSKTIKIGDFGSSIRYHQPIPEAATLTGTPFFLSPELKRKYSQMLLTNAADRVPYDPVKSDVYSLGVTLLYMTTLEPPTQLADLSILETGTQAVLLQLAQFPYLQKYLGWMFTIEPEQRPTFLEIKSRMDSIYPLFPTEIDATNAPTIIPGTDIPTPSNTEAATMQVEEVPHKKCVNCEENVHLTQSESSTFIILSCLDVFHSTDCFIQFLLKNQRQFIKKGCFLCPICQAPIRREDLPDDIGQKVMKSFEIPGNVCNVCLIEKPDYKYESCGHRVCRVCHRRNPETGDFYCPICSE